MRILRNGEWTELEGNLVALVGRIMVVQVEEEANMVVPGKWLYDGEVYTIEELLDGDPFGIGDYLSIKTLKATLDAESHEVTAYFAFEMGNDTTARAILPFNIENGS
jgi:hypothetical protein